MGELNLIFQLTGIGASDRFGGLRCQIDAQFAVCGIAAGIGAAVRLFLEGHAVHGRRAAAAVAHPAA